MIIKQTQDISLIYRFKYLLVMLFTMLLLTGCYFDVMVEERIVETSDISFSDDIIPIFQSSCISCHDGIVAYPLLIENYAYESLWSGNYINVDDAKSCMLIKKIQEDHPFEGAVTNTEMEKIILWIEQGASNN